jgi:hypothetical protein
MSAELLLLEQTRESQFSSKPLLARQRRNPRAPRQPSLSLSRLAPFIKKKYLPLFEKDEP